MQLCYNGLTTKYATLLQDINSAAKAGFTALELREDKLADYLIENSMQSLKDLLDELGLVVCTINSIEITQQQGEGIKHDEIMEKLEWMCKMAQELGADSLVTAPLFNDNNWTFEQNKEYLVKIYHKMSNIGTKYGIRLGFEVIAHSTAMVPNLKNALEIIEAIDRENVGLCFDCFAFHGNDSKLDTIAKIPKDKLFMVHINDAKVGIDKINLGEQDRRFPGEGEIDLKSVISSIKDVGYDGAFSTELITPYIWEWDVQEAVNKAYETTNKVISEIY